MKTTQMKTTKTVWAPPPNHLHRPRHANRKMVWVLWSATTALLAAWLGLLTLGYTYGGRVHFLLIAIAIMAVSTFVYGLGHDEYFERPQKPRPRKWKLGRSRDLRAETHGDEK